MTLNTIYKYYEKNVKVYIESPCHTLGNKIYILRK